ncbi:MAG: hypothetical protein Q9171_004673 [Xanthocarpia ochracea]
MVSRDGNSKSPGPEDETASGAEKITTQDRPVIPLEQSQFYQSLREYRLEPSENEEIYEYYRNLYEEDAKVTRSKNSPDSIHQILEADAADEQTNPGSVHPWRRRKGPIGTGGQSIVWLWEKQTASDNSTPRLQVAVKDATRDHFWRDQPAEGILLRKLEELGCKTVITVYDWMYKPAALPDENAIIRTIEEYAEHGDVASLLSFYAQYKLILPEAFLWHIFWSAANTLCYCRHGTTQPSTTLPGWDPIMHMDIKPSNFLMKRPDDTINALYPSIKMSDFGLAYTVPEKGNDKVRAWKSTWQFGTTGFKAPEVAHLIRPSIGSFDPVPPNALHGSHTDIYSLGVTIFFLMKISIQAVTRLDTVDARHVQNYYSDELRTLANWCQGRGINTRPLVYDLFLQTQKGMKKYQRIARKEETDAAVEWPFHSQVLYTKESQIRFRHDPVFRIMYERVNRAPLEDGEKTEDPGETPTSPHGRPGSEKSPTQRESFETTEKSSSSSSPESKNRSDHNTTSANHSSLYRSSSSSKASSRNTSDPRNRTERPRRPPLEPNPDSEEVARQYENFMNDYMNNQPQADPEPAPEEPPQPSPEGSPQLSPPPANSDTQSTPQSTSEPQPPAPEDPPATSS